VLADAGDSVTAGPVLAAADLAGGRHVLTGATPVAGLICGLDGLGFCAMASGKGEGGRLFFR